LAGEAKNEVQARASRGSPHFLKTKDKEGLWSPEEDEKLINYMMKNCLIGCSWSYVAKDVGK